jgi:hypothetical protein
MRKQAEVSLLENRIRLLETTVEGMSNEFIEFGDRVLSSGLSGERRILGDLGTTTKRFLDLAKVIDDEMEDGQHNSTPPSHPGPELTGLSGFAPSFATGIPTSLAQSYRSNSLMGQSQIDNRIGSQGSFSPRLNHGLLSESSFPSFLTEYLLGGIATFSARLYLETLDTVLKTLNGELNLPGFIPSVCRYRLKHQPRHVFMDLVRSRVEKMGVEYEAAHNTTVLDPSASDTEIASTLVPLAQVAKLRPVVTICINDLVKEGGSPEDWLDPWNTQQYLRNQWQLAITSTTVMVPAHILQPVQLDQDENPFLGISPAEASLGTISYSPGHSHLETPSTLYQQHFDAILAPREYGLFPQPQRPTPNVIMDVKPLVQRLVLDTVCFGNGPRFPRYKIDSAVRSFLDHTLVTGKYEFA